VTSDQRPRTLPERARAWAAAHAPRPVVDVTPVGGGITNTKWLLHLDEGDPLVIRWSDPELWGATGREHVRREIMACRLLTGSALPAPKLVADDPDGLVAGGPADLLTWLPGRARLDPLSPAAVTALARLAVAVHRQPVPVQQHPTTFTFRGPPKPEVPGWSDAPHLWRQAIDVLAAGPPPTPYGLLHRDFHLGNTLWQGDRVSGLVDWAETSWGPPDLDVAHLCSDFAMLHSPLEVEIFRAAYGQQGGRLDADVTATRFWQVADILGFLPDPAHILASVGPSRPDLTPDSIRRGLQDLLARALA